MKILGIDPGSAICGWGVIEKDDQTNRTKLVDCGCVRTTNHRSSAERLQLVYDGIEAVIKKFKPAEVAVEELFFVQNVKTGIAVGQARGVILLAAAKNKLPVFEYKPTQIKMALSGYGRASKGQVQEMVKLILKLDKPIKQDDTADAVAVAICHLNYANHPNSPELHANKFNRTNYANRIRITLKSDAEQNMDKSVVYPELSYEIVGVLQKVSNILGFVAHERQYYPAIEKQFDERGIAYKKQVPVKLDFGCFRGRYFVDYLIDGKVVLEIKVGSRYTKQDVDQLMGYLRATGKELGILARFTRSGVDCKRFLRGRNIAR